MVMVVLVLVMLVESHHMSIRLHLHLMCHSATPLRPDVNAPTSDRHTSDHTEKGVDANISNDNAQATFLGSSRVTSIGTLEKTFLVDKNIVPIKAHNIPCIYTLFNLLL